MSRGLRWRENRAGRVMGPPGRLGPGPAGNRRSVSSPTPTTPLRPPNAPGLQPLTRQRYPACWRCHRGVSLPGHLSCTGLHPTERHTRRQRHLRSPHPPAPTCQPSKPPHPRTHTHNNPLAAPTRRAHRAKLRGLVLAPGAGPAAAAAAPTALVDRLSLLAASAAALGGAGPAGRYLGLAHEAAVAGRAALAGGQPGSAEQVGVAASGGVGGGG